MISEPLYTTKESVLAKAKEANGHTIGEYNIKPRKLDKNFKGSIGQIIEEGLFGYPVNSRAEPDFAKIGVELKVTGLRQRKNNTYVPKERLVLNVINYEQEGKSCFDESSFWKKNQNLLMMFYLYNDNRDYANFPIIDSELFSFPPADLEIIKSDWEAINKKIKDGEAQTITEGDTMYLGACTKAQNAANGWTVQPFSHERAKKRAYCLKNSYLRQIVDRMGIQAKCEHIFSVQELSGKSFEVALKYKLQPYYNKTTDEIAEGLGCSLSESKNYLALLVAKMLSLRSSVNKTDEFLKSNTVLKVIRVQKNKKIRESMSFPVFDFCKIVNEEWDTSELRMYFYESKFMFVVFRENDVGKYVFDKVVFWNMPMETIDSDVYAVWQETKENLKSGRIVRNIKTNINGDEVYQTYFPGMKYNKVCHVRPHARDRNDRNPLPVPDMLTGLQSYEKQCFWLNSAYVASIIGLD